MTNANTKPAATITCECWKCGGTGHIAAFRGIANGVCFTCGGTGRKTGRARRPAPLKPLTEYQATIVETITTGDMSGLTYPELADLRTSAHWPLPQVPNLLAIWRERGEPLFMESQARWLESYRASR